MTDVAGLMHEAGALMQSGRFNDALPLLGEASKRDPSDWNAEYLAGQCCRFMGDLDGAVEHLTRAARLAPRQPNVFLALGIAHQFRASWEMSIEALRHATELDPHYAEAYNSAALTQRKCGRLEEALENYDLGAKALARRLVKQMRNDRGNPILKHRDTVGDLWMEYAAYAGMYLAVEDDRVSFGWPTGASAEEEERRERHGGLYWIDVPRDDGAIDRTFLPNFFNTFREALRCGSMYATLIGNRGTVLALVGRDEEAGEHFEEATEFSRGS